MNRPSWIIIHHSAVSYSLNPEQFDAIDRYHRSKGWGGIGYHYMITKNGEVRKGRYEDKVGAHCYQKGMNYKSIGICLAGFFDHEDHTSQQMESLKTLVQDVRARHGISTEHVVGHRFFAPKSCPGKRFTDEMIKEVATNMSIKDPALIERVKGKLLLQVQDRGKLWYVTDAGKREYLGTSYMQYRAFMKRVREGNVPTLGISNEDINKVPKA